jgi:hypothetical protein
MSLYADKTCFTCKRTIPADRFGKDNKSLDGLRYSCKKCEQQYTRKWRQNNPKKYKEANKKASLKYLFGMTLTEYNAMITAQNNACAICNTSFSIFKKQPSVDHCHKSGKVRALLCTKCNPGLGLFNDNTTLLRAAISYLERFSE